MPKIIQIGKCLLKLQLKMSGVFFETQCSRKVKPVHWCTAVGLPYFNTRPSPTYQRFVGESVTMVCDAGGDPRPVISWIKVSRFCTSSDTDARLCFTCRSCPATINGRCARVVEMRLLRAATEHCVWGLIIIGMYRDRRWRSRNVQPFLAQWFNKPRQCDR